MRTIKSLLVASLFTVSIALAAGCADLESVDDELEYEDLESDQADDEVPFSYPTDEQIEKYEACMDRLQENGANYRDAHRLCKSLALE